MISNKVPVAKNLVNGGVNLVLLTCSVCYLNDEEVDHIFFKCNFSTQIWSWFITWSGLLASIPGDRLELLTMLATPVSDKKKKKLKLTLIYSVIWLIWKARNSLMFNKER